MLHLVLESPESPLICEVMVPQLSLLSMTFTLRTAQLFAERASVWLVRRLPRDQIRGCASLAETPQK